MRNRGRRRSFDERLLFWLFYAVMAVGGYFIYAGTHSWAAAYVAWGIVLVVMAARYNRER